MRPEPAAAAAAAASASLFCALTLEPVSGDAVGFFGWWISRNRWWCEVVRLVTPNSQLPSGELGVICVLRHLGVSSHLSFSGTLKSVFRKAFFF